MSKIQINPNCNENDLQLYYNLMLHPGLFHIDKHLIPNKSVIKIKIESNNNINNNYYSASILKNIHVVNEEPIEFVLNLKREVKINNLLPQNIIDQHSALKNIENCSEHLFLEYLDILPKLYNVFVIIIIPNKHLYYEIKSKFNYCVVLNS